MVFGQVAEPEVEDDTPDHADDAEDPKDMTPMLFHYWWKNKFLTLCLVHQRQHDERRDAAAEAPGHPDGALGEAAFLKGEPVVKRPRNVRICTRLADAEQESHRQHRPERQ